MLHDIYTAVKSRLNELDSEAVIKGIEWYNVQYEGSITATPRIFIEFPEALNFEEVTKDALKRAPVRVRLHVVTQAMSGADGVIDDSVAENHENVAMWAKDTLDHFLPINGSCKTLHFTAWQHFHKYKGWMVTFVEFVARKNI